MNAPSQEELRKEEVANWLSFASRDMTTAQYLFNGAFYPLPLEIICFHCQQAAEKAIKAVIVYFGSQGGIPKQHDIAFLLNQIKHIVKENRGIEVTEDLLDYAQELSQFGVMARYPNSLEIDEHATKSALTHAKAIMDWVSKVVREDVDQSQVDE